MKKLALIFFAIANALFGETQIDGFSQIKASPVLTFRTATNITSAWNPVSSTWQQMGKFVSSGFLEPKFIRSQLVWKEQQTDKFLTAGGANPDTRVNLANSQFWVPGSTSLTTQSIETGVSFEGPTIGIEADVMAGFGSGSTRTFEIRYGDGTNWWTVKWDEAANTVTLNKISGGNTVLATFSGTLTPPFRLMFSLANGHFAAKAQTISSAETEPYTLTGATYIIPEGDSMDPRTDTRLAAYNRIGLTWTSAGNSGRTFQLGKVRAGYLHEINGLPDQPVCFSDGPPIETDSGEHYLVYLASYTPAGSGNANIQSAGMKIKAVDPRTMTESTDSIIFTNRSGKVTGENSGCVVYHIPDDTTYYFINNYGDANITTSTNLRMYLYKTKGFPHGVVVLQNPVAIVLPQSATNGLGDPCARWFSNKWNLVYAVYLSGYSGFAPSYCTIDNLANVGSAGNWTQVAQVTPVGGTGIEGNKWLFVGGNKYIISAQGTQQNVYDLSLNLLGTFNDPPGTGLTPAHFCSTIYPEGYDSQVVYWWYWDATEYDGASNYMHGEMHVAKSALQTGRDNPRRLLMDAMGRK